MPASSDEIAVIKPRKSARGKVTHLRVLGEVGEGLLDLAAGELAEAAQQGVATAGGGGVVGPAECALVEVLLGDKLPLLGAGQGHGGGDVQVAGGHGSGVEVQGAVLLDRHGGGLALFWWKAGGERRVGRRAR